MSNDRLFDAVINPLQWLSLDQPWASLPGAEPPTLESALSFLCAPGVPSDLDSLANRYREISTEQPRLFLAPAEGQILDKLVWPLRNAKASYTLGNYLGTISLCGLVAEMVAVLLWDIADAQINGRPFTEKDQDAVFGRAFEKLGQERRVDVLAGYGLIEPVINEAFDVIRAKRRQYLHLWSRDHARLPNDAVAVYQAAVSLVVRATIKDIQDGKVILNPRLVKYLERAGVIEPERHSPPGAPSGAPPRKGER